MNSWPLVPIDSLGRVVTGTTPPSALPELFGDEVPFLTPSDMTFESKFVRTERSLSVETAARFSKRLIPTGSVCFVCIASVGKICFTTETVLTNQQINSVVVDS